MWELISNITLVIAVLALAAFAGLGLYQWIKRKSLKKVDSELLWVPLPLILMVITYFVFDKFIILATRPNGSGEPSFPSSHVMTVATIFFIIFIILPKYIESRTTRIILELLMVVLLALTCAGRIFSNMHSMNDVLGSLVFSFIFAEVYYLIIKKGVKNAKHLHKNHQ